MHLNNSSDFHICCCIGAIFPSLRIFITTITIRETQNKPHKTNHLGSTRLITLITTASRYSPGWTRLRIPVWRGFVLCWWYLKSYFYLQINNFLYKVTSIYLLLLFSESLQYRCTFVISESFWRSVCYRFHFYFICFLSS